jgi:hypothetical protein
MSLGCGCSAEQDKKGEERQMTRVMIFVELSIHD